MAIALFLSSITSLINTPGLISFLSLLIRLHYPAPAAPPKPTMKTTFSPASLLAMAAFAGAVANAAVVERAIPSRVLNNLPTQVVDLLESAPTSVDGVIEAISDEISLAIEQIQNLGLPSASSTGAPDLQGIISLLEDAAAQLGPGGSRLSRRQLLPGAPPRPGPSGLMSNLQGIQGNIQGQTGGLREVIENLQHGSVSPSLAMPQILPFFDNTESTLGDAIADILNTAGINVPFQDTNALVDIVVDIVEEILGVVADLLRTTGLEEPVSSLVNSLIQVIGELLGAVDGVGSGLLDSVVEALDPVLSGLGDGVLAPVLEPLTDILDGLTGETNLSQTAAQLQADIPQGGVGSLLGGSGGPLGRRSAECLSN
ncbi:hypothetical protein S7711_02308 [Stachybotrys chartarum IBT 7711]|uniref:Uncharacterized protein n=1 Tax=Stachybotrys chartarum (strain CBS 109288 / IBT 7711) TaxID=1280523 RepID=A0A084B0W8_STACB|nr:hypothetical protein S7711_02308 [Stachybotrys chartarum IBT 7711]